MANSTRAPQQPGAAASPPIDNKEFEDSTQPSNAVPVKATSVEKVNRLQPYQTQESDNIELPFAMERYLDETPNAGGATYGLVHGSGHHNVFDVLAVVDTEFGDVKVPT